MTNFYKWKTVTYEKRLSDTVLDKMKKTPMDDGR